MVDDQKVFARNEEKYLFSDLGEDAVMMDLETGNYLGINEVASDIWKILKDSMTMKELILKLTSMYEVSEDQCRSDILEYLDDMEKKEMLVIKNSAFGE